VVAFFDVALWQSVVAEEQQVGVEALQLGPKLLGEGVNEEGVVKEVAYNLDGGEIPGPLNQAHNLFSRAAVSRGGVLWKERQDDDAVAALVLETLKAARDGGGAVAHPDLHHKVGAHSGSQGGLLRLGVDHKGGTLGLPDLSIGRR